MAAKKKTSMKPIKKEALLAIRLTDDELKGFKAMAIEDGIDNVSVWARQRLREIAKRKAPQ
jgi:hypothetical protein